MVNKRKSELNQIAILEYKRKIYNKCEIATLVGKHLGTDFKTAWIDKIYYFDDFQLEFKRNKIIVKAKIKNILSKILITLSKLKREGIID